jgi:superfamily II DNA/RNA helicase
MNDPLTAQGVDSQNPVGAAESEIPESAACRFSDFALAPDVHTALAKMGLHTPTPIQAKVIGPILEGKDVIGKAETGTGKTIGFGAPLVGKIDTQRVAVQALILTPTRELAQQVAAVLRQVGEGRGLKVALVVGGVHASEQVIELRSGSQVVVGTPGRVLDFLRDRTLSLVWCETVVLDEADRLFDMGFIDEIHAILDHVPAERQTLLFSATIPGPVQKLMHKYMRDPVLRSTAKGIATVPDIRQSYREVDFPAKFRELCAILDANPDDTCIIFCNTRRQARDLDRMLFGHNYPARALHGDHEQDVRFRILESFRSKELRILVATDVASRGLDIENVGMVINFEVPVDAESYVHRIGRTGRASRQGVALTLVAPKESSRWRRILAETRFPIDREIPAAAKPTRGAPSREGDRRPRRSSTRRDNPMQPSSDPQNRPSEPSAENRPRGESSQDEPRRRRRRRGGRNRNRQGFGPPAEAPAQGPPRADAGPPPRGPQGAPGRGANVEGPPRPHAARPRRERERSGPGGGQPREDTLFDNPLKRSRGERVAPVNAEVDFFDLSMRDFLDDEKVALQDFTSDVPSREAPEGPREAPAGDRPDDASRPHHGPRRHPHHRGEPGGSRPGSENAAGGGGSGGGDSDAGGQRRRRRRRRPGGPRGSGSDAPRHGPGAPPS